jgi:hypothetical protein
MGGEVEKENTTYRGFRVATSRASSDEALAWACDELGLNLTASRYGLKLFCSSMLGFCELCLQQQ